MTLCRSRSVCRSVSMDDGHGRGYGSGLVCPAPIGSALDSAGAERGARGALTEAIEESPRAAGGMDLVDKKLRPLAALASTVGA